MPVFKDKAIVEEMFGEIWTKMVKETEFGAKLKEGGISIYFVVNDPDVVMFVDENGPLFSLEVEILLGYLGLDKADITVGREGIFLEDKLLIPSPQGIMPMNYLVHPSNFTIIPASMVFEKKVNPSDFKGKIVLVGVTALEPQ